MATKNISTGSPKRAPRRAAGAGAGSASKSRAQSLADEASTAIRSVRTRAARAAKKVPTGATSLSITTGVIVGLLAAGIAIFMNRDRLRSAASTGGERLKKAADDLSTMAHDRIDQVRDNISRFRTTSCDANSEQANSDATAQHG